MKEQTNMGVTSKNCLQFILSFKIILNTSGIEIL